jgi:hypothetical protein
MCSELLCPQLLHIVAAGNCNFKFQTSLQNFVTVDYGVPNCLALVLWFLWSANTSCWTFIWWLVVYQGFSLYRCNQLKNIPLVGWHFSWWFPAILCMKSPVHYNHRFGSMIRKHILSSLNLRQYFPQLLVMPPVARLGDLTWFRNFITLPAWIHLVFIPMLFSSLAILH